MLLLIVMGAGVLVGSCFFPEQWKKGKLEQGWYYVKGADGLFGMMSDYALYRVNLEHPDNTISLLAPVPSFKEWKELKEASDGLSKLMFKSLMNRFVKADEERERLSEGNQQLKELLKEVRDAWVIYKPYDRSQLCKRIDNAIGEK